MMLQIGVSIMVAYAVLRVCCYVRVHMCQKRFIKKATNVRFLYELLKKYIETEEEAYAYVIKMWLKKYKLDGFNNSYEAAKRYLELAEDTLQEFELLESIAELDSGYYEVISDLNRRCSDIRYLNWLKNGI